MTVAKYEVYPDAAGEFRWRLKAANSRVVASGEGYKTRHGAHRGIEAHQRAAKTTKIIDR